MNFDYDDLPQRIAIVFAAIALAIFLAGIVAGCAVGLMI